MKINSVLCTLMVAGALFAANDCFASNTGASSAAVVTDEQNAAELYRAAWERHAELMEAFGAEQRRTEISSSSAEWTPEKETMEVLRACRPLVEDLIAATRAGSADWGVRETDDFFMELPHLRTLRESARLLAADARARIALNDHEGAAERIAAMFRMSGQLRHDDIIISSLVAMAICDFGAQMTELFIAEARPAPEHLAPIREAVEALPEEDPFAMLDAIKGDHRRMRTGFESWIDAGAPPEKAPASLEGPMRLAGAVVMMAQLERLDGCYEELVEAWQSDDASEEIAELERAIDAGQYGMLAQTMAPAMGKLHKADQRARTRFAEVRALLDAHR
ncbi:MAG: hypothetical protein JJU33_06395 [Phycisphaerales bacterium]|nr:hypothetical protein [Phycisphaerales bacterium]